MPLLFPYLTFGTSVLAGALCTIAEVFRHLKSPGVDLDSMDNLQSSLDVAVSNVREEVGHGGGTTMNLHFIQCVYCRNVASHGPFDDSGNTSPFEDMNRLVKKSKRGAPVIGAELLLRRSHETIQTRLCGKFRSISLVPSLLLI